MRRIIPISLAAAALAVAAAALAEDGNPRSHALSHLIPAMVVLAPLTTVLVRRPPTRRGPRIVAAAFVLLVAGLIAEAVGALGWDEYGVFEENEMLTTVHDVALFVPFVALLVAAAGLLVWLADTVRSRLVSRPTA